MLRARFHQDETKGWQQRIEKQLLDSYHFHTHAVKDAESAEEILQHSQGSLHLEHGPTFGSNLIEIAQPERQILFLTAHHLVIDLMSWRIVVQDLEQLLLSGTAHPARSMPFPAWCSALAEEAHQYGRDEIAPAVSDDESSWTFWGIEPGQYTSSQQVFVTAEIDQQTTDLLLGPAVNAAVRSTPVDILLAALLLSFKRTFPDRASPAVFIEDHGRNSSIDYELSDTVGWFTTITSMRVGDHSDLGTVSALKMVKELRRMRANRQVFDFANQYLPKAGWTPATAYRTREILFNYQGQFQQLERVEGLLRLHQLQSKLRDPQSIISSIGGNVKMQAALNVEVYIQAGRMQISVGFSENSPKGNAIRQWAQDYSRMIAEAVQVLLGTLPTVTPSDFPHARLNGDEDLAMVSGSMPAPGRNHLMARRRRHIALLCYPTRHSAQSNEVPFYILAERHLPCASDAKLPGRRH